jgi:hypothetical protein
MQQHIGDALFRYSLSYYSDTASIVPQGQKGDALYD